MKKRKNDRSRARKKSHTADECTIPPPPMRHILSSFTLDTATGKRAISDYVQSQARDEKVQHAEKVKTEHVLGNDYDCWDVHTQKSRYWVITSPTNLYSQELFPSLDYTLSLHVGLTARVMSRRGAPDSAQKARLTPVWRRWEEASAAFDAAEEAEDFQAVGMKRRVCLIHLGRSLANPAMVAPGETPPQRDNFVAWSELIANKIAPGPGSERIRGHLKATAKSAWEMVGWLTHTTDAARLDALFVLDTTHAVLSSFGSALIRSESKSPSRCPKCGSYSIGVGYNPELRRPYISECEKCGWQGPER
jgi:predicted RNA-binding Zn-ribbon protein involved in translation (DUF1610 family)